MAPCEWVIDIIKEWVIDQAYATIVYVDAEITALKAWVEAKLYLQKAEYPGYGMPIHVTGDPSPDVTCTYFRCGDLNGKPCYSQEDGSYFIFWVAAFWFIGTVLGGAPPSHKFRRDDPSVFGAFFGVGGSTGTPTVVSGYKYLLTSFVDRGDPALYDFLTGDLTLDGAWHDLDLSGIVPVGAKAVLLSLQVQNNVISKFAYFRKNGNANTINVSVSVSQIATIFLGSDIACPLDTDRKIEYVFFGGGWTFVSIAVKGWWL